eukprot:CAMPEP_0113394452 /NCGR_PEP_ID=MMETSP0013_2-20120614/12512_1 /TAXON_ID=2843 ORGANISM="Skeletonema costatum, Strain 1716" /NCGR_SAMPLE_ID=MMETSP0013_2 /ASSEMBLY_ACC=CAM_ASM_000158 /LENGTH=385 /DNA_ID=CAMNT_0000278285 /DNA_START=117 /DNA_END=1274 /DNA_ORIENTATION=- /assembly_acc=CAM_ASM_000158
MAFQRLTTNSYAGRRFQQHITTDIANLATPTTRRRRRNNFKLVMSMDNSDATTKVTQYTINDSVCPPTDPDTLTKIVQKHIHALPRYWFSRPVANHTAEAFQEAMDFVNEYREKKQFPDASKVNVILDSGCGTGKSSVILGEMYPNCVVIGVDQSIARLSRNKSYQQSDDSEETDSKKDTSVHTDVQENNINNQDTNQNDNVLLLRAELSDFWKCCLSSTQWQERASIDKHYLLYPNPYPKKSRLKSRFYAHPAFPLLMMTIMMDDDTSDGDVLSAEEDKLVVRSNWEGYLNEFKSAVGIWQDCGGTFSEWTKTYLASDIPNPADGWHPTNESPVKFESGGPNRMDIIIKDDPSLLPMTNFEAKYLESGESIYELTARVVRSTES